MGKLHYLTALLLIILLAVVSGWIFESIDIKPGTKEKKVRHTPDYFLKNFTSTTMNDRGEPAYKIKAQHLEHYPDNSMKLQQPFFTFYNNNKITWTAKADKAQTLNNNEIIHLNGNVILNQEFHSKTKEVPVHLKADQLTIDTEKNIAHTQSKIKLNKGKSYIQANGIRADLNKNRIEFLSNTRSHYVLPAK
ncbi:MAG: LPS export ABC transporter periplasmic protein LptC [Gammaproteobacteria bacterium]|nr:LPS export ABC transporter periplasmic protein LptC [Gammaproteobacteria bacterium]